MNYLKTAAIGALSLSLLAACEQKTTSSVSDAPAATSAASAATSAPTETVASTQALTSQNGKLTINVTGQFADKLSEAGQLISDIPTEQLLLLQKDEATGTLLYAADLGKAKTDAAAYLKNLSDAIKADANLKNVEVGAIDGNKLTYHFSEGEADSEMNQACVAIHQDSIYSVCAISSSASTSQLAQLLSNVSIK